MAVLAAALAALPLGIHFLHHPEDFLGRADQVAVWNTRIVHASPLAALLHSAEATLLMFVVRGDGDWKYNLANRPVFDPISAVFFLLGLATAIWRRDRASRAVLVWWIGMLAPGFLSIDAPQFMRTLGAAPPAVLLAALGIETTAGKIAAFAPRLTQIARLVWYWPIVAGAFAAYQYFGVWAPSPAAYLALEGDVTAAAGIIRTDSPNYAITYVASRYGPDPTISFLDGAQFGRLRWFDGRTVLPLPPPGSGPTLYVLPRTAIDPAWYDLLPAADRLARVSAPDTGPAVEAFVLRPGEVQTPAPLESPVDYGGVARLVGAEVPSVWQAGVQITPTFFWQIEHPPSGEVKFWAHLDDARGHTWAQFDEVAYPAAEWQPGQALIVRRPIGVPDTVPPGTYTLAVGIETDQGAALPATDATGRSLGNAWRSAPFAMARPAHPPDVARLAPARRLDATFGGSLRLVGATLDQSKLQDGDDLSFTLFWQVLRPPGKIDLSLELRGADGAPATRVARPPSDGLWPSTDWKAGDVVVDREQLHVPVGTSAGLASLRIGVQDASGKSWSVDGGGTAVEVGQVAISRRPISTAPVAIPHPQVARFLGGVRLVGYDVTPDPARPGSTLQLILYWQADGPVDRSWTIFTHVLGSDEKIVAQQDDIPASGQRPTSTWEPGEIIVDRHDLVIPSGAAPGADQLEVGLYDARTGQRLSLVGGGDRVLLGQGIGVR